VSFDKSLAGAYSLTAQAFSTSMTFGYELNPAASDTQARQFTYALAGEAEPGTVLSGTYTVTSSPGGSPRGDRILRRRRS
jgi:hypothetical protein